MRKITKQATSAFLSGSTFKGANMVVKDNAMFLHGNKIAYRENGNLYITNCGWFSNTTKDRLNALPNVSISQKKGIWYLNGEIWDGNPVKVG